MFKDEEVSSKFSNKKTEKNEKYSIVAMVFEIYYQKVKLKLMKSFDATKKFAVGYMFLKALYLPPKRG